MPEPRKYFYVSVISGAKRALLAGPYDTHAAALERVETVRAKAETVDAWAVHYAFGTAGSEASRMTYFGVL